MVAIISPTPHERVREACSSQRISTCLETEIDRSEALNSIETQTFLGEVFIIHCQLTPQLLTPRAHEWVKGVPVLKRRMEFYLFNFPFLFILPSHCLWKKSHSCVNLAANEACLSPDVPCFPPLKLEWWRERKTPRQHTGGAWMTLRGCPGLWALGCERPQDHIFQRVVPKPGWSPVSPEALLKRRDSSMLHLRLTESESAGGWWGEKGILICAPLKVLRVSNSQGTADLMSFSSDVWNPPFVCWDRGSGERGVREREGKQGSTRENRALWDITVFINKIRYKQSRYWNRFLMKMNQTKAYQFKEEKTAKKELDLQNFYFILML